MTDLCAAPLQTGRRPLPPASRPRVLVVDDERVVADTVVQILNMHGFDAFCAYNGPEAMKLAEGFRPDCLLTSLTMSLLNGIDLAVAVEKMLPSIKILLFSGAESRSTLPEQQYPGTSMFPTIAKPIHPERLVQRLRGLLRRRKSSHAPLTGPGAGHLHTA